MSLLTPSRPGVATAQLVHPRLDGFLAGWFGLAVWAVVWIGQTQGVDLDGSSTAFVLLASLVQGAHFMMSYRLAYFGGAETVRSHPVALVLVPLALTVIAVAVAVVALGSGVAAVAGTTSFLITLVYVTSGYHFVRQSYGVSRIGFRYAGVKLTERESAVLKWAAYPIWLSGLVPLLGTGEAHHYYGFPVDTINTGALGSLIRGAGLVAIALLAAVYIAVWRRGQPVTSLMLAPYASVAVWMLVPVGGIAAASFAFTLAHAVQYLACCYRVERNRPMGGGTAGLAKWWYVLIVATAAGALVTRGVPRWLDSALSGAGAPLLFSALAFCVLNLNHYVTDAVIWRSSGRLLAPPAQLAAAPSSPRARRTR